MNCLNFTWIKISSLFRANDAYLPLGKGSLSIYIFALECFWLAHRQVKTMSYSRCRVEHGMTTGRLPLAAALVDVFNLRKGRVSDKLKRI